MPALHARWPFVAALLVLTVAPPARARVVINELAYDDSGDDDEEFIELYNASDSDIDLGGWRLATGTGGAPGAQLTLPAGASIVARGFFVIGSSLVPGVDLPVASPDFLGNGPSYVTLFDADDEPVDSVAYEANKGLDGFPDAASAEGAIWGNYTLVSSTHLSLGRWFDGYDSDENAADFGHLPWTPGASNDREFTTELVNDFEDLAPEQLVDGLVGSFVGGIVVDPFLVTPSHPNAIDESPDGGFALVAWDPAGGGNFVVLDARPAADMLFEAWVFFDATPELADESETWSIGLRGSSGTFYNIPILFDANGNTGVTWTYQVTSAGAMLRLIDEGLGGPAADRARIAELPIIAGDNDGWQRLRLEVRGDEVVGWFGGEYGDPDSGERFEGTLSRVGLGNFWIGYREAVNDNASARPPTLDRLEVRALGDEEPPIAFRRGDANADGSTNLSDAVFTLNWLFLSGSAPGCVAAVDANGDAMSNLSDAVFVLNHLFSGGAEPPAPFGDCGPDPSEDGLDCAAFAPCA